MLARACIKDRSGSMEFVGSLFSLVRLMGGVLQEIFESQSRTIQGTNIPEVKALCLFILEPLSQFPKTPFARHHSLDGVLTEVWQCVLRKQWTPMWLGKSYFQWLLGRRNAYRYVGVMSTWLHKHMICAHAFVFPEHQNILNNNKLTRWNNFFLLIFIHFSYYFYWLFGNFTS